MKISKKALKSLKTINAKAELMKVFQMGERGIIKMIERNDIRLTTLPAMDAIKKVTGLKESEILTAA